MHKSSESVAALATALAKAQGELVNPEKSLTASIRGERRGEGDRTFHYAPLASGLDIVRKTLGKHELAILQTTGIDQSNGMVNLTTVLAHSSGEWMSSEYPVCQLVDIAVPHRMGAALTYARRYALFALVGIAGEDDLDAPDLDIVPDLAQFLTKANGRAAEEIHAKQNPTGRFHVKSRHSRSAASDIRPQVFDTEKSKSTRECLIKEIERVTSPDEVTSWAHAAIPIKNQLTTIDAELVEKAFAKQVAAFEAEGELPSAIEADSTKTAHLLRGPPRRRDKQHLKYISKQACLVCGRQPSDPHHLRFAQAAALGRKVSDEFTVPLCRSHHRDLHRSSDEPNWWKGVGIEPMSIAGRLWTATHQTNTSPDSVDRISMSTNDRRAHAGRGRNSGRRHARPTAAHDLAKTE
jgi:hypothetical protein